MSPLSQYHHYHNITISPLSQYHQYHHDRNITTITISPLSEDHKYHNITIIKISPISPRSQYRQYHHNHNITIITRSPLSQHHHCHSITSITITTTIITTTITTITYRFSVWKVELLCYGWQWLWNGCQISTLKRSHSQEISQPRDLHSQEITQPRDPKRSFRFWRKSRTKASFSHLPLPLFEGSLAQSFVFALPLLDFEGSLARNAFLRDSGCTECCVLQDKTCPGRWMGKLIRQTVAEHVRLGSDHGRIGPAVELTAQASFSQLSAQGVNFIFTTVRAGGKLQHWGIRYAHRDR